LIYVKYSIKAELQTLHNFPTLLKLMLNTPVRQAMKKIRKMLPFGSKILQAKRLSGVALSGKGNEDNIKVPELKDAKPVETMESSHLESHKVDKNKVGEVGEKSSNQYRQRQKTTRVPLETHRKMKPGGMGLAQFRSWIEGQEEPPVTTALQENVSPLPLQPRRPTQQWQKPRIPRDSLSLKPLAAKSFAEKYYHPAWDTAELRQHQSDIVDFLYPRAKKWHFHHGAKYPAAAFESPLGKGPPKQNPLLMQGKSPWTRSLPNVMSVSSKCHRST